MMLRFFATATLVALGATAAGLAYAQHGKAPTGAAAGGGQHGASGAAPAHAAPPTTACTPASVGPQSPRDITSKAGANANATFALASKPGPNMRLCNIHFHKNAEHKGTGFNRAASEGTGHQCNGRMPADYKSPHPELPNGACGQSVKPGDTIEVHWVFTSCADAKPGATLGACSTATCKTPTLRVESQVYLLVNNSKRPQAVLGVVASFDDHGAVVGQGKQGEHGFLPRKLPTAGAHPVLYRGSTTNPAYDNATTCSPLSVTWQVRRNCTPLDIKSLDSWCERTSAFKGGSQPIEAHGARKLVNTQTLLSQID